MALNFKRWLLKKLTGEQSRVSAEAITEEDWLDAAAETYVREIAFWSCVNIVANAIGKCEFKTYIKGRETKGEEYYLWNIEPNKNQNSSAFIHKWIAQLYQHNEALVIESQGQLLVADGFIRTPYALYDDVFTQVTVGDFTFNKAFHQSDVLYFTLSERDMRKVTAGLYESYRKMLDYGMRAYQRSRGSRGILSISTLAKNDPGFADSFKKIKNEYFKEFFNSENAVLPLFDGYKYDDLGSKTYSESTTRDIRAMIDDVSDFTAKALGIPPKLLSGEVQGTSDAVEQLITFCIVPLVEMIEEEINRKRYGKKAYLEGSRLQIDTRNIKHYDLLAVATAIDKLISSGVFTINDIREVLGQTQIDEDWANTNFMTKNYATLEELMKSMQGGETE